MTPRDGAGDSLTLRCDGPTDAPGDDTRPPSDTFTLLSDETRVDILRELAAASESGPLRFSELRERAGVADAGRFNYHLKQLRGRLVRKTDGGYELTAEGEDAADLV